MQLRDFQRHCGAMLQSFTECADEGFAERIAAARRRLSGERLKILVIGRFSRGKSTFINALIGEPILPSCALPTTATISLLRGGARRSAIVTYRDGHQEWLDLPSARTYSYLDYVVTSKNGRARTIRQVHLSLPGRLEQIQADLVDTPGVHELDELREDIVFRYLREADAVVVLLDSQQPLTSLERVFLRECVPDHGLRRMIFVINKVDELSEADPYDTKRLDTLVQQVGQRLGELAGMAAPEVFAVSALKVLRARYMGIPSPWMGRFEALESRLLSFANAHALSGRLRGYCIRLKRWIGQQLRLLEIRSLALASAPELASAGLPALRREQDQLQGRLAALQKRLEGFEERMRPLVAEMWGIEVERLRLRLAAVLREAGSDTFGLELSRELRRLVGRFESGASSLCATFEHDMNSELSPVQTDVSERLIDDLLGLLADSFLPGPWTDIGQHPAAEGAAVPKAALSGSRLREAVDRRCDRLQSRRDELADRVSSRYARALREGIQHSAAHYAQELETAVEAGQLAKTLGAGERAKHLEEIDRRIARLRALQVACVGLADYDTSGYAEKQAKPTAVGNGA